ncbi:MAG: DegT/DnrJ/EryC1/StrS family aminotransferase [Dehalococcoidia bacterium]
MSLKSFEKLAIHGGSKLRDEPFGPRWVFGQEEKDKLIEVIDEVIEFDFDNLNGKGWRSRNKVKEFCDIFAARHNMKYAVPANSATSAIHAAIAAIDPEPGSEVITTPVTDTGGVLGIMLQNCVPVFADSEPLTMNIDPDDIERKITKKTVAIIATHIYGNPCDMGRILKIKEKYKIPVIEDCSQSHLAKYQGELVGTLGDIGIWSLGGKTLSTGQGGMLLTNSEKLATRATGFVNKGVSIQTENRDGVDSPYGSTPPPRSTSTAPRNNYCSFLGAFYAMTDLEAAVGLAQYEKWDEATRVRIRAAQLLSETVENLPGFTPPYVRSGDVHSYYVYPYRVNPEEAGITSDEFSKAVRAEGIPDCFGTYLDGKALYKYPLFSEGKTYGNSSYPFIPDDDSGLKNYQNTSLPVIEKELPNTGSILLRNSYTESDVMDIANAMKKVSNYFSSKV